MAEIKFEITNLGQFQQSLRFAGRQAVPAAAAALTEEAERIMGVAKARTPVDTGALRGSGHVQAPVVALGRVGVTLAFGGAAAPYAVIVHEDLTARHVVGQAKFLESAMLDAQRGMVDRLWATVVARYLARAGR